VLDGLTPRQRALLWLAYVEGLQHREIADVLGLSRLSIRPLLFRARRRMARELRARGIGPVGVAGRSS
jgi:RNA polymerase sigma-70 factor (ECF subfamily)